MDMKAIVRKMLREYSSERRLPFDDDYFKNKNYLEQYKDWLEDFGKYGTLPPSTLDFWKESEKAVKIIVDNKLNGRYYKIDDYNEYDIIHEFGNIVRPHIIMTDDNKIYVERAVKIDSSAKNYDSSNIEGKDPQKLYSKLKMQYNDNVGGCWSYKRNGSQSYCSTDDDGDEIILKGLIRTDDIDFIKTVLLNFHYSEEHEIRVKPKAKIEIFEVKFNCKYKIPLKGHLIVNATYFGNNGKYEGGYAKVDDGFGNYKLIDRKGEISEIQHVVGEKIKRGLPIDYIFTEINKLNDNLRVGTFHGKKFLIDKNDKVIGDGNLMFDDVLYFTEKLSKLKTKNGFYLIDNNANILQGQYLLIDSLIDGFARVKNNDGKFSFIDENGELIGNGNLWFDFIGEPKNNVSIVKNGGKYSIFYKGKLFNDGKTWFKYISYFNDKLYMVRLDDKLDYFLMSLDGRFYDYETREEIPNPFMTNESTNIKLNKLINETFRKYIKENII